MATATETADAGRRRRGFARRLLGAGAGALLGGYAGLVLAGLMNPSTPVDYVMNLGSFPHREALARPDDGRVRLAVLQHGLWRSAGSLWKLERALEDHGYRVLNVSYPSTAGRIEEHAEALARHIEAEYAAGAIDELYFAGHSLGGLVIQAYLLREDARVPTGTVFIGTPHRGAMLAGLRRSGLPFKLFLGYAASLQLVPGHPFHARRIAVPGRIGTIAGAKGDGEGFNDDIPGDDDGTVALDEARLSGEDDAATLPVGHTRLSFDDRTVHLVLHFFKHGVFPG